MIRRISPTHWVYILIHAVVIMLGYILAGKEDVLVKSIGASLIAAGLTGEVVFVYIFTSDEIKNKLKILLDFGITNAFDGRSVTIASEYETRLNKLHKNLDIIGYGLSSLRQDHLKSFLCWNKKASVRILLLDPEFPNGNYSIADQRDLEENNPIGEIKQDVVTFAQSVDKLELSQDPYPFEIKLYKCIPSLNLFRVDDDLFWGPYLVGKQSRNCPTFIARRGGVVFQRFMNHFDEIWDNPNFSRPIPAEWLQSGSEGKENES